MHAVPVLSIIVSPIPCIDAVRYIKLRQLPLPRKAIGKEPNAVTMIDKNIGIVLFLKR